MDSRGNGVLKSGEVDSFGGELQLEKIEHLANPAEPLGLPNRSRET